MEMEEKKNKTSSKKTKENATTSKINNKTMVHEKEESYF